MKTRIVTAVVGLAVLAVVMMFFNTPVLEIMVSLVAMIGVHEIFKAYGFGKKELHIYLAFLPYILLVMFVSYGPMGAFLVPLSYVLMVYLAICLIARSQTLSAAKLGGMVCFSAVVIVGFYSMVYIKNALPAAQYGHEAIYLIIMGLAFAWGGDTFAYFTGCWLGKHKLAPIVSPKKTIEGAIGGVLGSGLLGVVCTAAARSLPAGMNLTEYVMGGTFSYLTVFLLGMICSVLGILGDLFASAVKRQCAIKDYGTIFPGHGGILDRFDSVLFIMPVVAIAVWLRTGVL